MRIRSCAVFVLSFVLSLFSAVGHASADFSSDEIQEWSKNAAKRCSQSEHPIIYTTDTRWGLSFLDAADLAQKFYVSPKRLKNRFYSPDGIQFQGLGHGTNEPLNIPLRFIYSVAKQIESALRLEYAQWVIFPDMGHNHFFISEKTKEAASKLSQNERVEMYMNADDTKMLYHVLEQIQVKDKETKILDTDSWAQWRFYNRNLVGDNKGEGTIEIHKNLKHSYNTAGEPPVGYAYYGAGVNVSANENGCFPYIYKGKTYYFDISFFDLAADPNAPPDDYYRHSGKIRK